MIQIPCPSRHTPHDEPELPPEERPPDLEPQCLCVCGCAELVGWWGDCCERCTAGEHT